MSWEICLLVIQKVLELLVNTLTTKDMYSLLYRDKLPQPIQMQISKKKYTFYFRIFEIYIKIRMFLKKRMTLRAYISPKLRTAKNVVRSRSKGPCLRRPFEKKDGKRSQRLFKSTRQHLHRNYWLIWVKLSWTKSLLVIQKVLGLLVKRLTTDENFFLFFIATS